MLTKEKIESYRKILEKERGELLREIDEEKKRLDFGSDVDSFDEEADEAEELGNELAIEAVLKKRVRNIDEALGRIKNGTYGICQKCANPIPEKVLDVVPESLICDNCKK